MNEHSRLPASWLKYDVRQLAAWQHMTDAVIDELIDAVEQLKGAPAARLLRSRGIERLHEVVEAGDVGKLREHVLERLRMPLLHMAVAVGRQALGWRDDFYVDDYLILRINFPYDVARLADPRTENPGIGRLSPSVREVFQSRKVIDPVYDPKAYHRGHPPPAWAHGPHIDSWAGHSRDGRNIWWAIGEVPPEAGMVMYPETAGQALPCEPKTLYLRAGYPLPQPTFLPLRAGEMLVFDPEVLHGTHLNTTDGTRVAISMRLNSARPSFDPACFYAREFWRRAADIEAGRDEVLHLRREDNLGAPVPPRAVQPAPPLVQLAGDYDAVSGEVAVQLPPLAQGERTVVTAGEQRMMVVATAGGLRAYDAACPHYGVDLADGAVGERKVYCPACAVGFDLETGKSPTPTLTLRSYELVRIRTRAYPHHAMTATALPDATSFAVSVVLCTRNGHTRGYLGRALASVFGQARLPLEVLLIDDGSDDGTAAEVSASYPAVRVLANQGRGLAAARNTGVRAARGDWIAFIDDDDLWHRDKLAVQAAQALDCPAPSSLILAALNDFIDRDGSRLRLPMSVHLASWPACLLGAVLAPSGMVLSKALLVRVGMFDESIADGAAYDCMIRCLAAGAHVVYSPQVLMHYRRHDGQMTGAARRLAHISAHDALVLRHASALAPVQAERIVSARRLSNTRSLLRYCGSAVALRYWRGTRLPWHASWQVLCYAVLDLLASRAPQGPREALRRRAVRLLFG